MPSVCAAQAETDTDRRRLRPPLADPDEKIRRTWRSSSSGDATSSTRCRGSSTSYRIRRPSRSAALHVRPRDSRPSRSRVASAMLAASARFGSVTRRVGRPISILGFAGGAGSDELLLHARPAPPDGPGDNAHEAAIGLDGIGALGLRLHFAARKPCRLDLRAEYRGSTIYTIVTRDATRDGRALRTDSVSSTCSTARRSRSAARSEHGRPPPPSGIPRRPDKSQRRGRCPRSCRPRRPV